MPYYEYQCPMCKAVFVEKKPMDERDNVPVCCVPTERVIITPPKGFVDVPAAG